MPLEARLFGAPELRVGDGWIPLPLDKRGALLAVLATAGAPVHRSRLAALFWPQATHANARTNLRALLARVRSSSLPVRVELTGEDLAWDVRTDVQEFSSALREGRWLAAAESGGKTFLEGLELRDATEYSSWLELERRSLEAGWRRAVAAAAEDLVTDGQARRALELLRAARRRDPLDESMLQACLVLAARDADLIGDVLRDFESYRFLLAQDLGLEPAPHTLALAGTLRTAEPSSLRGHSGTFADAGQSAPDRLPHPSTPTIRRDLDVEEVASRLMDSGTRWITLTGPGGVGKTTLALQVAKEVRARYADGAYWFSLAGVRGASSLLVALANGLDLRLDGETDVFHRLVNRLRGREMLLVMDDLDGLLDAGGSITDLLRHCRAVKVLATCRSSLGEIVESPLEVRGLSYPASADVPMLENYEAIRLFALRARQVLGEYRLRSEDVPAAVEICRLVDGSPLGIELAAARTGTATVLEILDLLQHAAGAVVTDLVDAPSRHRSLKASFDFAWEDLPAQQRSGACGLSVLRSPFDAAAASAVADVSNETLVSLLTRSFLKRADSGLFTFHALVRQFANTELRRDPTAESRALDRHADYFAAEVERHGRWMRGGELQAGSVAALFRQLDDVHVAWDRFLAARDGEGLARFLPMLHLYEIRGLYELGVPRFAATAAALPALSRTRAHALTASAVLAGRLGRLAASRAAVEESLSIWAKLGEQDPVSVLHLGVVAWLECDFAGAESVWTEAQRLAEEQRDEWCRLSAAGNLGICSLRVGDLDRAEVQLLEARNGWAVSGDDWGRSFAEINLGSVALARGDLRAARTRFEAALQLARGIGQVRIVMEALESLVSVAEYEGKTSEATRHREELVATAARSGLELSASA